MGRSHTRVRVDTGTSSESEKHVKRILSLVVTGILTLLVAFSSGLATPTASAYSPGTNVISGRTIWIPSSYTVDVETGALAAPGADLWWHAFTSTTRQLQPLGSSQLRNLGAVNFDALTATSIAALPMGTTPINGSNVGNQLVVNDVFVVRTAAGNVAKYKVLATGANLLVQYVTYLKPLTAPVIVSPVNGASFSHYPRTTTINWTRVPGATSYVVERAYYSGTWVNYPPVTVSGEANTSLTWAFVGDQAGRARVTAYNARNLSGASAFVNFSYRTGITLATPVQTGPANGVALHNYPRTTTLSWQPVPGASAYRVEVEYFDTAWRPYVNTQVANVLSSSYTFAFVGKQPGRWRITAIGTGAYRTSAASAWRTFTYTI